MSDKLVKDFDLFYAELKNKTKIFKTASQGISTDPHLSRAGKSASLAELQKNHEKDLGELGGRFNSEFGQRVSNIADAVNGSRSDIRIGSIQAKLKKGEDISSDDATRLLLHEMSENKTIMRKSNFQGMLSNTDTEQIKKTAQSLNDGQDAEKLEWLKELADLRGEGALGGSIGGQIKGIRDANLNDEQRNLKTVSERIEKGLKLFTYSIEKSKTGEFLDVRQEEIIDSE